MLIPLTCTLFIPEFLVINLRNTAFAVFVQFKFSFVESDNQQHLICFSCKLRMLCLMNEEVN